MRLYWYPLKVLKNTIPLVAKQNEVHHMPFGIIFNIMLWILLAMDIYWFMVCQWIAILSLLHFKSRFGRFLS